MRQILFFSVVALFFSCGSNNTGSTTTAGGEQTVKAEGGNTTASETPSSQPAPEAAASEFVITGKIANAASQQVFLDKYFISKSQQNVTSTMTSADGSFTLKGKITEKGLFLIRLNNNVNWLMALESGKYNFKGDANDIYKHSTEGSPESESFSAFVVKAGQNQLALSQFNQQFSVAKSMGQMQQMTNAQQQYQAKFQESQKYLRTTIETVQYPLVAVFAASLLDPENNADYLEKFIAKANQQMPGSSYVKELKEKLDLSTRLAIGRIAPDIKLKSPKGESIALSSTRGKVILLDFWASWCRPCRNENPNVVRLYDKYHAKGFDVFSVSLDQNMDKWVSAIQADNLKWKNHGSTLQGWQCPVAATYEVHSIPNTLLLDKDGKIISKNLRGEELESKLRELFGT